jgi:hypothetical protein
MKKNLEPVLRNLRSEVETKLEEQNLIKELLTIFYKRHECLSLNSNAIPNFADIFLKQSGLKVDHKIAFKEFEEYKRLKAMKYKPHIKLIIHNLKLLSFDEKIESQLWKSSNHKKENSIEISIVSGIDGNQKKKKKLKYKVSNLKTNAIYEIESEFIHELNNRSENISILIVFNRHQNDCKNTFCYLFNKQKVVSNEIIVQSIKQMPLIGINSCYSTRFATKDYEQSLLSISIEVSVEFCDEPKRNILFKNEKVKAHKKLISKVYNRWQKIPPQIKAIIELNRQQNGITKEDNLIIEANVWTQIKRLTEVNKLKKEFNDLINKVPTPEGSNFIDIGFNNNNNNNNFIPPLKDPQFDRKSTLKKKIAEYIDQ